MTNKANPASGGRLVSSEATSGLPATVAEGVEVMAVAAAAAAGPASSRGELHGCRFDLGRASFARLGLGRPSFLLARRPGPRAPDLRRSSV